MAKKKVRKVSVDDLNIRTSRKRKKPYGLVVGIIVILLAIVALIVLLVQQNQPAKKTAGGTPASSSSTPQFTLFTGNGFLGENAIKVGSTYYAWSSDAQSAPHVRLATSPDNVTFTASDTDILPTLPSWSATPDKLTRPGIWKVGDQYVLYSNYVNKASGLFAIGAATSSTIGGPYIPQPEPLLKAAYGVVSSYFDVSIYQENGTNYILYATDQAMGYDIWIQQLSADGLSAVGSPTKLLDYTKIPPYQGSGHVALVERPALVKAPDGKYVLIYSSDKVDLDTSYIGYAVSSSITGPYTNGGQFVSNDQMTGGLKGPSEPSVFQDGGKDYLIFNAWKGTHTSWTGIGTTATWSRYRVEFTWKDGHVPTLK